MINKDLIQLGNDKLGKEIAVINIQSAHDCSAAKEGLCSIVKDCYARAIETRFSKTLERNRRQEYEWDNTSYSEIADMLYEAYKKHHITHVRYNVFGDVRNQKDIAKIQDIAEECRFIPITFYLYTKRIDLEWFNLQNVVVNLSESNTIDWNISFLASSTDFDNAIRVVNSIDEYGNDKKRLKKKAVLCNADCRVCKVCMTKDDKIVYMIKH